MAISLNSNGLSLNYPTSIQTSGGKYPYGCAVAYKAQYDSYVSLNGTWAIITSSSDYSTYLPVYVGSSISGGQGFNVYALAIRVA